MRLTATGVPRQWAFKISPNDPCMKHTSLIRPNLVSKFSLSIAQMQMKSETIHLAKQRTKVTARNTKCIQFLQKKENVVKINKGNSKRRARINIKLAKINKGNRKKHKCIQVNKLRQ